MFTSASGTNRRQPKSINWSYRKRGNIQRTQMNTTMNTSIFARKIKMCAMPMRQRMRRLIQPPERQRPAAEKQRHHHRRRRNHVGIFAERKQRKFHGAVFHVVTTDQFLLRLGEIERRPVKPQISSLIK